jgi:hypothetical protein
MALLFLSISVIFYGIFPLPSSDFRKILRIIFTNKPILVIWPLPLGREATFGWRPKGLDTAADAAFSLPE